MKSYKHIIYIAAQIAYISGLCNISCANSFSESGFLTVNTGAYKQGYTADFDNDGMPDWWEIKYGLNPLINDANADPDNDGYTNLEEYNNGWSPIINSTFGIGTGYSFIFSYNALIIITDTDSDGMPDWWEIKYGLNPNLNDANDDPDNDGRSNLEEYNAGTNPMVNDWRGPSDYASQYFITDTGAYKQGYTADFDNDGMPDWWEVKYGLNPLINDANDDPDNDGRSNLDEYLIGWSPIVNDTFGIGIGFSVMFPYNALPITIDTDGDGMPDWWEIKYGLNPNLNDANDDPDNDGYTNLEEYNASTNPISKTPDKISLAESSTFTADTGDYRIGYMADFDNDGMPDWWEIKYNLNPLIDDSNENPDGDNMTNIEEYNAGTNPHEFDFMIVDAGEGNIFTVNTLGPFTDNDGDGLPDWIEAQYTGNPTLMVADADDDGDGISNYKEYIAGSNPHDRNSVFAVDDLKKTADKKEWVITWQTIPDRIYSVYSHTNLATTWPTSPVYQVIGDGNPKSYTNKVSSGSVIRFYRITVNLTQ